MGKNNNSKYYLNLNDLLEQNFERTDPIDVSYLDTVSRRFYQYDTHKKVMKVMGEFNKFLKKHEKDPNKYKLDAELDPKWDQLYFGAMSILSKNNKSAEFLLNEEYLKTVTRRENQVAFIKRMGRLRNKFKFDKKYLDNAIEGLGFGEELKDVTKEMEDRNKNRNKKLSKNVIQNNIYENLWFGIEHKEYFEDRKIQEEAWREMSKSNLKVGEMETISGHINEKAIANAKDIKTVTKEEMDAKKAEIERTL